MPRRPAGPHRRTATGVAALVALVGVAGGAAYTVQRGDTLSAIAARNEGVSVGDLAAANDLADPDHIVVGQTLTIPGPGGGAGDGAAGTDGAGEPDGGDSAPDTGDGRAPRTHVVERGETLAGIARSYGVSAAELASVNGLSDPDRILTGQRLFVDATTPLAPDRVVEVGGGGTYTVEPGDTLSRIAARHDVSVADLAAANDLADPDHIVVGQRLTLPGGWTCPVEGAEFRDDFGVAKPGGERFHEGVDLFAPRGTPVLAPVAGRAEQIVGERGGRQFFLHGRDGHLYIGSHLDEFGAGGEVTAGTVLGTVGDTGNARGGPTHLHFELHPEGAGAANPFPVLTAACR